MNYQARELIMQARLLMDDIEHKDYEDWAYADDEIHSLIEDLVKIVESKIPSSEECKPNYCRCSNCGWEGPISDCATEREEDCEGWLVYDVHVCPCCEDGGPIEDYWYEEEAA